MEHLSKNETSPQHRDLVIFSKKRLCSFPEPLTLSQTKKSSKPELRLCSKKTKTKKKETSSIHKVSQSEQVILFDALSHDQLLISRL